MSCTKKTRLAMLHNPFPVESGGHGDGFTTVKDECHKRWIRNQKLTVGGWCDS